MIYLKNANIARRINSGVERNVQRLVLGDWCNPQSLIGDNSSVIHLSPALQSEEVSSLLVKRLYSLLDEEAGVLIIVRKKNNAKKKGASVFDIPYLHENTLSDMRKLWMWNFCKLPFLFNVIGSIRLLFDINKSNNFIKGECPIQDIVSFCKKRNIKLEYYIVL